MADKEKIELKDGVISIFKRFNILDHTTTIGGLRDDILRYIDSLQEAKEVDLEKELSYEDYKGFFEKYPDLSDDWGFEEAWTFAQYFFTLGLKA